MKGMARILIIDDDPDYAQDLDALFSAKGHEVTVLNTCDGALDAIRTHSPDLLVLDVMFPDSAVAGFDLARRIRTIPEFARLPILLFSNINKEFPLEFSSDDIDPDWMPVQEFVDKSTPLEDVLLTMERLLESP